MIDSRIEIKLSSIKDAGYGVFAVIDIPSDTFLGYYKGQVVDIDKTGGTPPSDKLMTIRIKPTWWPEGIIFGKSAIIDGAVGGNWVTMINHTEIPNVDFDESGRFYTILPIKRGEELLTDYGYACWREGPVQLC